MLYDPNDLNANLAKTMNANEIVILWADAPEHVTVAAMTELPLKRIETVQIVPIRDTTALIPTIIIIIVIIVNKSASEQNTGVAKTVHQQGLVLKEWFQCLIVVSILNQPLHRHHNLV
jgi:hypothetical protein